MHARVRSDDSLLFAEESVTSAPALLPWKILIADDDEEVHRVTKLALADFTHFGRPLAFLDAYTGADAVHMVGQQPDIALVLMDVVMESDSAGLDAVLAIRNELRNRLTRIVIRTGQPGQAPEGFVVSHYGVDDYKEKTEVTSRKLHTLVHGGLTLYRDLAALTRHKEGLEQVIGASAALQAQQDEEAFARRALQQLAMILYAGADRMPSDMLIAVRGADRRSRVLSGTGYYAACAGRRVEEALSPETWLEVDGALAGKAQVLGARHFIAREPLAGGGDLLVYMAGHEAPRPADPTHAALLCRNVATGFENLRLQRELKQSQRSLATLLATAVEQRMHAGAGHGQRVGAYTRLLGELWGLPRDVLEWLPLAAMLHDIGHVAIPEAILNKRGPLLPDEQALFETHARWGRELLSSQDGAVLQAAAVIAAQHHERWDGAGYPEQLAGAQIHLHARLTALADAYDEGVNGPERRDPAEVLRALEAESGTRFDPQAVALLSRNLDRFRNK